MKNTICILVSIILALRFADAAEQAVPATELEIEQPAATPPVLELKNKSAFTVEHSGRNPFWPIGWKPSAKQGPTTIEQTGPEIPAHAFLVSSITMDPRDRFAIINGKVMTEGQVFGLQMGNQTYQITVKAIQDGKVVLLRRDQEIIVPLRRR